MNLVYSASLFLWYCCLAGSIIGITSAFQTHNWYNNKPPKLSILSTLSARKTLTKERSSLDAIHLAENLTKENPTRARHGKHRDSLDKAATAWISTAVVAPIVLSSNEVLAASTDIFSKGQLNPANFDPVCPASDGLYRFLQSSTATVVGEDNFVEYGPLIAGGLLRIRLELCVVESFFKEAVGPFIAKNGLSWILPLHETVETFLAGVIFALASTFILVGSTKIVSVLALYADLLIGVPLRLFGGFAYDRASGKPVTLDIGLGPFKTRLIGPPEPKDGEPKKQELDWSKAGVPGLLIVAISGTARFLGQLLGWIRDAFDNIDQFVGRYLIVWGTGYILIKFLHFKVFPDFP